MNKNIILASIIALLLAFAGVSLAGPGCGSMKGDHHPLSAETLKQLKDRLALSAKTEGSAEAVKSDQDVKKQEIQQSEKKLIGI